ncbi:MAG: hypothetical protein ACTSWR_00750 [Candidatus Helarchaeota archaeon]
MDFLKEYKVFNIRKPNYEYKFIKTPYSNLNNILEHGIPLGQAIMLAGPASIGKTSLAAVLASQFKNNIYVDADYKMNYDYIRTLYGYKYDLYILRSNLFEDILPVAYYMMKKYQSCIVLDSVPMLISKYDKFDTFEDSNYRTVGYISELLKKLYTVIYKNNSLIIIINQLRQDVRTGRVTIPGGTFLYHQTALYLYMRKHHVIKSSFDNILGFRALFDIVYNKFGKPGQCGMNYIFDQGFVNS